MVPKLPLFPELVGAAWHFWFLFPHFLCLWVETRGSWRLRALLRRLGDRKFKAHLASHEDVALPLSLTGDRAIHTSCRVREPPLGPGSAGKDEPVGALLSLDHPIPLCQTGSVALPESPLALSEKGAGRWDS